MLNPAFIPILMPSGLPMANLEGAWLMAAPNLLPYSNTFSSWAQNGTTSIQAATLKSPIDASRAAWKIVEDSTAASTHNITRNTAGYPGAENPGWFRLYVKAAERTRFWLYASSTAYFGVAVNLTTETMSDFIWNGTVTSKSLTALGDGWYEVAVYGFASFSSSVPKVVLALLDDDGNATFDGTGSAPYTEADPGLYVADAQLNRGSTLLPYTATTTLQTFPSLYAKTPTLTLGANANAATNDPTLDGWGWVHATDDYGRTTALTIPIGAPFTAYIAGLYTGTSGYILSFGADANNYHALQFSADDAVKIASKDAGGETVSATALTTVDASAILLSLRSDGTTLTACREDTGAEVTLAAESPTGTALLAVGSLPNGGSPVSGQTTYAAYIVGRTHNRSERQRVRRAMRSKVYADTNGGVTIL